MKPLPFSSSADRSASTSRLTGWRLFGVAIVVATGIGLFSAVVLKMAIAAAGGSLPWAQAATGWIDWYLWALLTPLVVKLARRLPVSGRGWPRALAAHAVFGALVSAVELALFALVMTGYNELFLGLDFRPYGDRYLTLIGRWLPLQMLIYALIVAVVTAVEHGRRARERDVKAAQLEVELARTQMHALQAQIQPHFLFNTLNTISMAVRESRNEVAVRMMAHLSGVLRRSIEAAARPVTTLRRELEFVGDYLRIEQYRLEDRLKIGWNVDRSLLDAEVPTMLLQPLVENAVRHGISDQVDGGEITIHAKSLNGRVALCVEDTGGGMGPGAEPGVGIGNVRSRLEAQYGPEASLSLESRDGGGTLARIVLPRNHDE